jgi:hypothetical protein
MPACKLIALSSNPNPAKKILSKNKYNQERETSRITIKRKICGSERRMQIKTCVFSELIVDKHHKPYHQMSSL